MSIHRCDECGRRRANVCVVGGRDLCMSCRPAPIQTVITRTEMLPSHRDPLIVPKAPLEVVR